ncbi:MULTISPECIES: outer membrane beta-barrel protein [unclassified Vibrio]|uniref:Outer membrane beta-barrel protein n=1 Tax=Vibrio sp. HB236076 TaxID=3232307 RepID=A0AB39HDB0_9VIBR|nr:outer membrane beta-barrel protein [Vibrio sp. HB161653]MDP5253574.1 outer membrane beta-barrel protein [Vibrio sp. HB161653]
MKRQQWLFCAALACASPYALAEEPTYQAFAPQSEESYLYTGVSGTFIESDLGDHQRFNHYMIGALVGYRFNDNLALDVRGYKSASEGSVSGESAALDRSLSALAKVILPVTENVEAYALGGYAHLRAEYNGEYTSDNDFQYGVGLAVKNDTPLEAHFEVLRVYDQDDVSIWGANINVIYKFY